MSDGIAKAYPIQLLNGRELVNDTLGDMPITVAWCPIVERSLIYRARFPRVTMRRFPAVRDSVFTFGVSGILRIFS